MALSLFAMLRLFYSQENQGAPAPQKRTRRQLELAEQAAAVVQPPSEHEQTGSSSSTIL